MFSPRNLAVTTAPPETQVRHVDHWPVIFHDPSRGQAFQANACPAAFPEKGRIPARTGWFWQVQKLPGSRKSKKPFSRLRWIVGCVSTAATCAQPPHSALSWLLSLGPLLPWVITNVIPIEKKMKVLENVDFLSFCLGLTTCSRMWH